jgi:hypothetical protein
MLYVDLKIPGGPPGVSNKTCGRGSRGYVGEGIEEMSQLIGNPILLQVSKVVAGVINAPLFELSPKNLVLSE